MNQKYLLSAALAGIYLSAPQTVAAQVAECYHAETTVAELLTNTDCRKHEDCIALQLPEPFGCNRVINKKHWPAADEAVECYKQACGPFLYNCSQPLRKISCEDRQCVAKPTLPQFYRPSNTTLNRHGRP